MLVELRRAWPYALVLGVVLGALLVVGANYSNAFPSQDHPFGWPGPSGFENAVAMVRGDLVLVTTVPALLLGASVWRATSKLGVVYAVDAGLLTLGVGVATLVGMIGAADTRPVSYLAFFVAHSLLAISFYSLAALCAALARRFAVPVAFAVWAFFVSIYEALVRTAVFREAGYNALASGQFPSWFYAAQAGSPLTAYRGVLILWDKKFMDGLEKAVLGDASLPGWLTPLNMGLFLVAAWIALPLGIAALVTWWRGREAAAAARAEPA